MATDFSCSLADNLFSRIVHGGDWLSIYLFLVDVGQFICFPLPMNMDPAANISADEVSSFTVMQLRAQLSTRGLDSSGRRTDLVKRLTEALIIIIISFLFFYFFYEVQASFTGKN